MECCKLEDTTADEATAAGGKDNEGSIAKSRTLVDVKDECVGGELEVAGDFVDGSSVLSGLDVEFALPSTVVGVAPRLSVMGEDVGLLPLPWPEEGARARSGLKENEESDASFEPAWSPKRNDPWDFAT